jgi:lipopolysaccharide export LptBFGC system permease protein LptF
MKGRPMLLQSRRMLTERELEAAIVKEDPRSWDGRELRGEYWRRIAMAIAPLLFAFLGIGFGTVRTRAVRASAILISMLTIILFLSLQSGGHILIQRGLLPAYLGQQIPNFVTGLIGLLAFRKGSLVKQSKSCSSTYQHTKTKLSTTVN